MDKQYLTQERLEELKKQVQILKTTRRAEVADRLKRAKELGDLSENSEYTEAREEQSQLESHIFELEEKLRNVEVIEKGVSGNTIRVGATVKVSKNGKETQFTIVGSNEADPAKGLISNESPLGQSLVGKKVGDEIKVKAPSGVITYKILKVE